MNKWIVRLLLSRDSGTKVLISGPEGDVLKARFPLPQHPRALLTLLEGAALWAGAPLPAVISAVGRGRPESAAILFGGGEPVDSALVRFIDAMPRTRARRLTGVGDFRQLYLIVPEVRR